MLNDTSARHASQTSHDHTSSSAGTTLWLLWDPLRFTLKGHVPRPSLRYVEAAMLIVVAFVTILLIEF